MNRARGLLGGDFGRGFVVFGIDCPQMLPFFFRPDFDSDPCDPRERWDVCDNDASCLNVVFGSGESNKSPAPLFSSLLRRLIRAGGSFVGEMEPLGAKMFAFRDLCGLLKGSGASTLATLLDPSPFAIKHVS